MTRTPSKPAWIQKLEARGVVLSVRDLRDVAAYRRQFARWEREDRLKAVAKSTLPKRHKAKEVTPCAR